MKAWTGTRLQQQQPRPAVRARAGSPGQQLQPIHLQPGVSEKAPVWTAMSAAYWRPINGLQGQSSQLKGATAGRGKAGFIRVACHASNSAWPEGSGNSSSSGTDAGSSRSHPLSSGSDTPSSSNTVNSSSSSSSSSSIGSLTAGSHPTTSSAATDQHRNSESGESISSSSSSGGGSSGSGSGGGGGKGGANSGGSSNGDPHRPGEHPANKMPKWFQVWMWVTALVYLVWRWQWRRERAVQRDLQQREAAQQEVLEQQWEAFSQRYGVPQGPGAKS